MRSRSSGGFAGIQVGGTDDGIPKRFCWRICQIDGVNLTEDGLMLPTRPWDTCDMQSSDLGQRTAFDLDVADLALHGL